MEDLAIAYGFNKLPRQFKDLGPVGRPLAINKLSDIVRIESAMAGWVEVMPLTLCSHDENFADLNHEDDGSTVVKLANPKSAEYQVVRTTLIPGLMKTLRENKHRHLPIKTFEVGDVVFKAPELERKARNERHVAAAFCGKSSGFEVIQGLLDRLMLMLKSAFLIAEEGLQLSEDWSGTDGGKQEEGLTEKRKVEIKVVKKNGYWIEESDDPMFFARHAADIHLRLDGKEQTVGHFGILHPAVLEKFEIKFPTSVMELNVEPFLR